jgi:uncharacterized protein (DUF433 family)
MATVKTEHPHIVQDPRILGGEPIIAGQRVAVRHVVVAYLQGDTIEALMRSFDLTEAQVHDALSYYYDHKQEIEKQIEQNKLRAVMREGDLLYVEGKGLLSRREWEALPERERRVFYTWETLPPA